jgi:hypothetical protein
MPATASNIRAAIGTSHANERALSERSVGLRTSRAQPSAPAPSARTAMSHEDQEPYAVTA